jgi:hypothetical protein
MLPLLLLALWVPAACGGDDDPCEPAYGGAATDEAWRAIVDGESRIVVGDPMAPVFTAPDPGARVAAGGVPPRITWTSPIAHKRARPHLPPVTDDVYLLGITVPGRVCPLSMLTTGLDWQLTASQWAELTAAGGQMSVRIVSAYLSENRITEGPFSPAGPLLFTVE